MMKYYIILIFLVCGSSFAQKFSYSANLESSKDSVYSYEEFTVTYTLLNCSQPYYIGIEDYFFEVIGTDRYEGDLKPGEQKVFTFKLRPRKDKILKTLSSVFFVIVGISGTPLNENMNGTNLSNCIDIIIKDADEIIGYQKSVLKGTSVKMNQVMKFDKNLMKKDLKMIDSTKVY